MVSILLLLACCIHMCDYRLEPLACALPFAFIALLVGANREEGLLSVCASVDAGVLSVMLVFMILLFDSSH
jgi:predicted branched-subunit amino acid permease